MREFRFFMGIRLVIWPPHLNGEIIKRDMFNTARARARFNFSINCQYEIVHICGIVSISMAK